MKKSCGAWLLAYVLIAAGIGAVVYRRLPISGAAIWTGVIAGFFCWLGVAYFAGIPAKLRDVAMMKRARDGEPPRDGERIAVMGRINPTGQAMIAPLSGAQCVAYDYDIKSWYGKDGSPYYSGFALTPSTIQSPSGSIRLLAWPNIKLHQTYLRGDDTRDRANEYISKTTFAEGGIGKIREGFAQMMEVYKDDDGSVRSDRKFPNAPSELINGRFKEKHVPAGAPVCVVGHYSAARGGIIPTDSPLMNQATLQLGDADSVVASAQRSVIGSFIGGTILVGLVLAALIGFYAFIPLEASEQMAPEMRFRWEEVRLERLLDDKVRTRFNVPREYVPLEVPSGTAKGRVRSGDTERDVSRANATRNGDLVSVDIDGVVVSFEVDHGKLARLNILGRDVDPRNASIQLRADEDSEIAGRLTCWTDGAACRISFRASLGAR